MSQSPYQHMLDIALRRGQSVKASRHRRIDVEGEYRKIQTFAGECRWLNGTIVCSYYNSDIFALDTINQRVTTFGMDRYSISTQAHLSGWRAAVRGLGIVPTSALYCGSDWVAKKAHQDPFMARVPWCQRVDGVNWFHWPAFDEDLAYAWGGGKYFLRQSQNWRYFTYAWNEQGEWERRFIDAEAEKRWNARERKKRKRDLSARLSGAPRAAHG